MNCRCWNSLIFGNFTLRNIIHKLLHYLPMQSFTEWWTSPHLHCTETLPLCKPLFYIQSSIDLLPINLIRCSTRLFFFITQLFHVLSLFYFQLNMGLHDLHIIAFCLHFTQHPYFSGNRVVLYSIYSTQISQDNHQLLSSNANKIKLNKPVIFVCSVY